MPTKNLPIVIVLFFIFLSIFLTLGRVGTAFNSFALLTPDLGVYASFAAAQEHPDLFARDPFLSNEKNTNSYHMIFVPMLKGLNKVFGNYGTAAAFLIPFAIFLHLTGYYLLGLSLFKNPWAGLLASLLIAVPINTVYDFWGLLLDALPRFLYQSLIPFVLVLSLHRGQNPKWWPVILGAIGLLNYVHPLSTPAWAAAVALGLWVAVPQIPFWKRFQYMALAGFVLLLILAPFLSNYFTSTVAETGNVVSYEETLALLQEHVSTMSTGNVLSLIGRFFVGRAGIHFDVLWYLIWLLGLGGILFGLLRSQDPDANQRLRPLAAWMCGIFIVGGLLTAAERMIFAYLKQIPPEIELLRTVRYLVPLVLLAALHALWLITNHFQKRRTLSAQTAWYLFTGAGVLLLLLWGVSSQWKPTELRGAVRQNITCWRQGHIICDLAPVHMEFIDMLNAIREQTPAGARILSEGQEVSIRYYALRPLVFTYKDGAPLAYTNQEQFLTWGRMYQEMDDLAFIRKFPFRRRAFLREITEFAQSSQAEYLLLREPYDSTMEYPQALRIVYTNDHYSLFEVLEE